MGRKRTLEMQPDLVSPLDPPNGQSLAGMPVLQSEAAHYGERRGPTAVTLQTP